MPQSTRKIEENRLAPSENLIHTRSQFPSTNTRTSNFQIIGNRVGETTARNGIETLRISLTISHNGAHEL